MNRKRDFLGHTCQPERRGICISVVIFGAIIGCVLLAYVSFISVTYNSNTLKQVAIIFRHGDRTPTETYPTDPYRTYNWPNGWGSLTKKGISELYNLGQWIRSQYAWLIGDEYQSSITSVRSSYAERCIMSAQSLLAALYSLASEDSVFDLAEFPVPINATPRNLDKLIVVKAPCPRLDKELKEAYANESIRSDAFLATYFAELTNYTGQKVSTITDVEFLYNTLEIEELNNLSLPEWTNQFYNEKMKELAARSLAIFTSNTVQQRLRGGPMLKEILERMKDIQNEENWKKMYLYSAHDLTLVNMLRAMGFTRELFKPNYGASLIFELHSTNKSRVQEVKLMYLNDTQTIEPHRMKIPGCQEPCLLDNLINNWRDVIPDDWDAECLL